MVFSHGWPLTADAWDPQLELVAAAGYRAVAHDRRGGGRSSQTWDGNDLNTYADDLHGLIEHLDLRDVVLVGHSTGGGEVTRYMGRHGTARVAKAVLLGAIPPLMLRTEANPEGLPVSAFDALRRPARRSTSSRAPVSASPRAGRTACPASTSSASTPTCSPSWPNPPRRRRLGTGAA